MAFEGAGQSDGVEIWRIEVEYKYNRKCRHSNLILTKIDCRNCSEI